MYELAKLAQRKANERWGGKHTLRLERFRVSIVQGKTTRLVARRSTSALRKAMFEKGLI